MPYEAYRHCAGIMIQSDNVDFLNRIKVHLGTLFAIPPGPRLRQEIAAARKQIAIVPTQNGMNLCQAPFPGRFVRMRRAMQQPPDLVAIADEIRTYLRQVVPPLPLVEFAQRVGWIYRIGAPGARGDYNRDYDLARHGRLPAATYVQVYDALYRLLNRGRIAAAEIIQAPGPNSYSIGDAIIRAMNGFLQPGVGANSTIRFDVNHATSCGNDGQPAQRPIFIGLAHELIHAWRNARGMRLFDDYNSVHLWDDELMTVGIPPYRNETMSENQFRLAHHVANRDAYRWIPQAYAGNPATIDPNAISDPAPQQ